MKIPSVINYRKHLVQWPSSATPDYSGQVGLIIHDGTFPYWRTTVSDAKELSDDMQQEVDELYAAAQREFCPVRKNDFSGFAMYGHLVNGFFFGRFAIRLQEAQGHAQCRVDMGMSRATLCRIMQMSGKHRHEYDGLLWVAPSVPAHNDANFGKYHARWNGKPELRCQYKHGSYPRVPMNGALLTDTFVPYSPANPISMRPTADQLEDMFL